MKHQKKINLYQSAMITLITLCCFNGSVIDTDSTTTSTAAEINFYGQLEDHTHTSNVESILIGGRYESIPVYQKVLQPITDVIDPKQNKALINLQDVRSIALQHPENPTASSVKINNKMYINIVVEYINGTKKEFLVEATRKVTCQEIDKSAEVAEKPTLQHRDISFMHIKKLSIEKYKYTQKKEPATPITRSKSTTDSSFNTTKNKFKTDTAQILNAIEQNVKNLPIDNPTVVETMRETILILLKSLRDQLQKFLDMVK